MIPINSIYLNYLAKTELQKAICADDQERAIALISQLSTKALKIPFQNGFTPLELSALFSKYKIASALIDRFAKKDKNGLNPRDEHGVPLLRNAIYIGESGDDDLLIKLISHLPSDELMEQDESGKTALHLLMLKRNRAVCTCLIEKLPLKGLFIRNRAGWSPIDYAKEHFPEIIPVIDMAFILREQDRKAKENSKPYTQKKEGI